MHSLAEGAGGSGSEQPMAPDSLHSTSTKPVPRPGLLEPVTFPFTMRTFQSVPVVVGVDDAGDEMNFVVSLLV